MSNPFVKYTFVCDPEECDALLEFTARDGFDFPSGVVQITCPCGRQMQYITATIVEDTKKEGTPMENVTTINATVEFLNAEIDKRNIRIHELEQNLGLANQRDAHTRMELNRVTDQMKDWTIEALGNREISESNAEEIAEICQFELVQEVEAEVSVTYYITVNVPAGENAEDIINDIDFDAVSYDSEAITNISSSVDSVSI